MVFTAPSMEQQPICTDDFGESVFACWHSERPTWASYSQTVGAIVPGVKARHVITGGQRGKDLHRDSVKQFQATEANCNTCVHLERVRHAKCAAGFLRGRCTSTQGQPSLSPTAGHGEGEIMAFHPDDPMQMPCHRQRP